MRAKSGSTGGGGAQGRKSSKASALSESMYRTAKKSENKRVASRAAKTNPRGNAGRSTKKK